MSRSLPIPRRARQAAAGALIVTLLIITVISAGCFEESPVLPVPLQTPTPATASPTPTVIPGGSLPSGSLPVDTEAMSVGYVERPYGYAPYLLSVSKPISIQDRGEVTTDEMGRQVITGKIKNIGNNRIDHIVVTITLYNRNGEVIGDTHARLDYLLPGKVWKFQSDPITITGYSSHEIVDVFTG